MIKTKIVISPCYLCLFADNQFLSGAKSTQPPSSLRTQLSLELRFCFLNINIIFFARVDFRSQLGLLRKIAKAAMKIGDKVGIHESRVGSVTFGDKKVRTSSLGKIGR